LKRNNFITRALASAAYVILIIASLLLGNLSFGMFCIIILIFSFDEYFSLMKRLKIESLNVLATIAAVSLLILLILFKNAVVDSAFLYLTPLAFIVVMAGQMIGKNRNPITNVTISCFSFIYILIPLACLYLLGFYEKYALNNEFNYEILLGFFILNWSSDTGAYLAGNAIGKHKLFERISPKKTIEGSIGGMILTLTMAYFISKYFDQVSLLDWIIIAVLIVVFGTIGDLFESMLKRKADVKDSGKLIPGHGGILDRFDSILFSAPVVFVYLNIIGQ